MNLTDDTNENIDEDTIDWSTIPAQAGQDYCRASNTEDWNHNTWVFKSNIYVHTWFRYNEYGLYIYFDAKNKLYIIKKSKNNGQSIYQASRVCKPYNSLKSAKLAYSILLGSYTTKDEI
jgi:hypothetical protein